MIISQVSYRTNGPLVYFTALFAYVKQTPGISPHWCGKSPHFHGYPPPSPHGWGWVREGGGSWLQMTSALLVQLITFVTLINGSLGIFRLGVF